MHFANDLLICKKATVVNAHFLRCIFFEFINNDAEIFFLVQVVPDADLCSGVTDYSW